MRPLSRAAGSLLGGAGTAVLVLALAAPVAASPCTAGWTGAYRRIDLGTLGGTQSYVNGMNDFGQLVGWSFNARGQMLPFLWQHGKMRGLAPLTVSDDWNGGNAVAINNRGDVVGNSVTAAGKVHAVLWPHGGRPVDLGTLVPGADGGAGAEEGSGALAVNDQGQVVGWSTHPDGGQHAFLWQEGRMTDLGTSARFSVTGINNRGWVVGTLLPAPEQPVAVVWRAGRVLRIAGPPSNAMAVNEAGQVVGDLPDPAGGGHAFLWQRGRLTDLGVPRGGIGSVALSINDRGQILGRSEDARMRLIPLLWQNGRMIDLTRYGVPVNSQPAAINDRGDIVVTAPADDGRYGMAVLFQRTNAVTHHGLGP